MCHDMELQKLCEQFMYKETKNMQKLFRKKIKLKNKLVKL